MKGNDPTTNVVVVGVVIVVEKRERERKVN